MKVILNIRDGLTKETRNKMRRICLKKGINYGELLNQKFSTGGE